ncbi:TIGR02281 family clan AA aspartic protease [Novosphingobium sp. MW5]|nr:TIGR02281 family clan AA aspartic protease [Novosphingobium sp. MW5]
MTRLITLALSAIASMLLIMQFVAPSSEPKVAATEVAEASPGSGKGVMFADAGLREDQIQIARDGSGQFNLRARVNGAEERFLIDTGADVVALTVETAEAAGLPVDPANFRAIMQTASGEGMGARFKVDDFEVAGRHFRDLDVVVMEGLETNLLGQSVLRKFGKVELRGDRMVISHD